MEINVRAIRRSPDFSVQYRVDFGRSARLLKRPKVDRLIILCQKVYTSFTLFSVVDNCFFYLFAVVEHF